MTVILLWGAQTFVLIGWENSKPEHREFWQIEIQLVGLARGLQLIDVSICVIGRYEYKRSWD